MANNLPPPKNGSFTFTLPIDFGTSQMAPAQPTLPGFTAPKPQKVDPNAVTWDSVVGLADAKQALREAIELPQQNSAIYKAYGKQPTKGVLLYGPPGCGKTMLGKAVAHSLKGDKPDTKDPETGEPTAAFQYVKGPEVLSKWVGQSEENIRNLFIRARRHQKLAKYQGVIFIDEADTLFMSRDGARNEFMAGLTNTFLAEMDGMDEIHPLVLLSTNRPDGLDPAVVRDGRVDHKIRIGRPGPEAVLDIVKNGLKGIPKAPKCGDLAQLATDAIFNTEHRDPLLRVFVKGSIECMPVYLHHAVNGALVVGVVERAKANAIRRDIAAKRKKARGIEPDDILAAIADSEQGLRGMNNMHIVQELVEDLREVANVEKVR